MDRFYTVLPTNGLVSAPARQGHDNERYEEDSDRSFEAMFAVRHMDLEFLSEARRAESERQKECYARDCIYTAAYDSAQTAAGVRPFAACNRRYYYCNGKGNKRQFEPMTALRDVNFEVMSSAYRTKCDCPQQCQLCSYVERIA
jgi:hypothetical protein